MKKLSKLFIWASGIMTLTVTLTFFLTRGLTVRPFGILDVLLSGWCFAMLVINWPRRKA